MTNLKARIIRHINSAGPMPLAEFMMWCLADPQDGYYHANSIFGSKGDFITAPEVSQMFGELIGIWLIKTWQTLGKPRQLSLVELGPGRGTLMSDILKTSTLSPEFNAALQVHMIEISKELKNQQSDKLAPHQNVGWHERFDQAPDHMPTIVIANEFLDALPFRQYVKSADKWRERAITVYEDNQLGWGLTNAFLEENALPGDHLEEPDGSVYEIAPTREALIDEVSSHIAKSGGAALFIDYGHINPGFGDTFQAIKAHQYTDPLREPGNADLTSHVDFSAFPKIVAANNCHAFDVKTQGEFLLEMGLLERAGALGQKADKKTRERLTRETERLALPDEMGNLFKVFAFSSSSTLWPFHD